MGKTIALKLSEKEEQIITQLNKQGMSNSKLLRNALYQYFEHIHVSSIEDIQMKNTFVKEENTQTEFSDSFKELKQEMQELREQVKKTQKQVENNVRTLQRQLYLFTVTAPISQQIPSPVKRDIVRDIHQQVDEFLNNQS
jgi:gas vesicle protein